MRRELGQKEVMEMAYAVEIKGIRQKFGEKEVLKGINLKVLKGEIRPVGAFGGREDHIGQDPDRAAWAKRREPSVFSGGGEGLPEIWHDDGQFRAL